MIFSILSFFEYYYGVDVPFVEIIENYPKIHVPLFGLRINVPMNFAVIIMWLVMSYYALYFYSFKGFLKVFVKEKMFEYESLNRLRFFFKIKYYSFVVYINSLSFTAY